MGFKPNFLKLFSLKEYNIELIVLSSSLNQLISTVWCPLQILLKPKLDYCIMSFVVSKSSLGTHTEKKPNETKKTPHNSWFNSYSAWRKPKCMVKTILFRKQQNHWTSITPTSSFWLKYSNSYDATNCIHLQWLQPVPLSFKDTDIISWTKEIHVLFCFLSTRRFY